MLKNTNNIILVGHPGSGKTTLGLKISQKLNKKFIDLDKEIENLINLKIKNIFYLYGEKFFREKENLLIKNFSKENNIVLSTGAGSILLQENRKILSSSGLIIYIKSDIEKCINRIINNNERPLINKYKKNINNRNYIKNLFKNREILYENISNIKININDESIENILKQILYLINKI